MNEKSARLISNVFNPFLMAFAILVLLGFEDATDNLEALKWIGISLALSVVPVLIAVWWFVRHKKLDGMFTNPREQRTRLYALAVIVGAAGFAVMWLFDGPALLRATFTGGLVAILVFMVVNFFWKISLHTAFVSASATVLTIVYGGIGAVSLLLLPTVGWARLVLNQHTPYQVLAGAVCAAAIVVAVFAACACL